jgi:hypothetical protein
MDRLKLALVDDEARAALLKRIRNETEPDFG